MADSSISILEACEDPNLFGNWFQDKESWWPWFVFLKAIFAYPMDQEEFEFYKECTNRDSVPNDRVQEATLVIGRRGGKALDLNTNILTTDGWKKFGDIKPGDYVYHPSGKPTMVVAETPVWEDRPCYELSFHDGTKIVADENHEWFGYDAYALRRSRRGSRQLDSESVRNLPTMNMSKVVADRTGEKINEFTVVRPVVYGDTAKWHCECDCGWAGTVTDHNLTKASCPRDCRKRYSSTLWTTGELYELVNDPDHPKHQGKSASFVIPLSAPLEDEEKELPLDPYLLDIWLGDGNKYGDTITSGDIENWHYLKSVEKVEPRPTKCIQVESEDGLFLAGDGLIPTHNSLVISLIAVYLACFKDWRPYLAPGERATVSVLAQDRKQARVIFRYINAFIREVPILYNMLIHDTSESLELNNQVVIEIHTASFRATRGYSLCAALLDEVAYWQGEDTANPDTEILAALRPAMGTIPGSMLFMASSPFGREGVLWENYDEYFGYNSDDVLVWQAPTWCMNKRFPKNEVERAYSRDPVRARAEYGAEFRSDIETFVSREAILNVISDSVYEREPVRGHEYIAFVDPSGGSQDSFTLAIGHRELHGNDEVAAKLDLIREYAPPFSPDQVVEEMCNIVKSYGCRMVTGDRYGGEWVADRFAEYDIEYVVSSLNKSSLYREFLPLINSSVCDLLDNDKMLQQILSLQRSGSTEKIDHPRGRHDDVANAVAGCMYLVANTRPLEMW